MNIKEYFDKLSLEEIMMDINEDVELMNIPVQDSILYNLFSHGVLKDTDFNYNLHIRHMSEECVDYEITATRLQPYKISYTLDEDEKIIRLQINKCN